MKALSNIQGPMGGEPLCFQEAALIFIGFACETGSPNWGGEDLQLCLGAHTCPWRGLKKTGGAPTQAFTIAKFSAIHKRQTNKTYRSFQQTFIFARSAQVQVVVYTH